VKVACDLIIAILNSNLEKDICSHRASVLRPSLLAGSWRWQQFKLEASTKEERAYCQCLTWSLHPAHPWAASVHSDHCRRAVDLLNLRTGWREGLLPTAVVRL